MNRTIGIVAAVAIMTSPVMAVTLIGNNPNVSGGGLNYDPNPSPLPWVKTGGGNNARLTNDRGGPDGGDWAVGGSDGSGVSPPYENYYSQTFTLTPGMYDISLSGYAKAWAGWWSGENFQWKQEAHIELWVDGIKKADMMSSNNTNRDTWQLWSHVGTYTVNNNVQVRLRTVKGNSNDGAGPYGAIWWDSRYDDITLIVNPAGSCPDPSSISTVSPPEVVVPPVPGIVSVTINGNNLTNVNTVVLQGPVNINGTIVTKTATQIVANFDFSTAPFGTYDLRATRSAPCTDALKAAAIVKRCGVPNALVREVHGDRGRHGNPAHVVTLKGDNLVVGGVPNITTVKLRKTNHNDVAPEITGTNLTAVGNDVQVTFDLSNAEGGRYDVLYSLTHPCATISPASHAKAFLVYMPALTNGSFEEGYKSDPTTGFYCDPPGPGEWWNGGNGFGNRPKPKHWDEFRWDFNNGHQGQLRRDNFVGGPNCLGTVLPNISGQHFGGFDLNAFGITRSGMLSMFQTIDMTPYLSGGVLTSPFNVRAEFWIGNPTTVGYIRLIGDTEADGDDEGAPLNPKVLAQTVIPPAPPGTYGFVTDPAYNAVIPAGTVWPTSNPPLLTIEIRFQVSLNGLYGFSVDNVRTGPYTPPACQGRFIWADSDDDQDVDMRDFGDLQLCLGDTTNPLPTACVCYDRDSNGLITDTDLTAFINCFTGPAVPWSQVITPNCQP